MAKRKSKSKPKQNRKAIQTFDPEQSVRFLETAKKLEADESGAAFERAMDVIAPKKKGP